MPIVYVFSALAFSYIGIEVFKMRRNLSTNNRNKKRKMIMPLLD